MGYSTDDVDSLALDHVCTLAGEDYKSARCPNCQFLVLLLWGRFRKWYVLIC
jgi:hypothetical protein